MNHRTYYRRKAAGLCVDCAEGVAADGRVSCERCLAKNNARQRALYHDRKGRRICTECTRPARPDRVTCRDHAG